MTLGVIGLDITGVLIYYGTSLTGNENVDACEDVVLENWDIFRMD